MVSSRLAAGLAFALLVATTSLALAQSAEPDKRETLIQNRQRQAGEAFSALQKEQYRAKLAEQDFLNAQAAYDALQTDDRRRQLELARKSHAAAQEQVIQARKRYEAAVAAVDEAFKSK